MAITNEKLERFMAAQNRAKKLIQMDMSGELNKYSGKAAEIYESNMNGSTPQQTQQSYSYETPEKPLSIPQNSKLPKEIIESFKSKQIDVSPLGYGVTSSILDEVNMRTQGQLFNEQKTQNAVVENNTTQQSTNVDYSMIKMIVEDCMKKYTSALKKSLLNENQTKSKNDQLQAMKIGDKFSFITKNGDLYEADLKFIKNINKKG